MHRPRSVSIVYVTGQYSYMLADSECIGMCLNLTQFNYTPLMLAAWQGHSSIVELLLSKGADPNLRNNVSHLISGQCCIECCILNIIYNYTGWENCIRLCS